MASGQRVDHGCHACNRRACTGGADDRRGQAGCAGYARQVGDSRPCGQREHEGLRTHAGAGVAHGFHQFRARLALTQNRHRLAALQGAAAQQSLKSVYPMGFEVERISHGWRGAFGLRAYYLKLPNTFTVPSSPSLSASALTPHALRAALGLFATGVTIVTARAPDGSLMGLTANSFNSVSLTPPLVLWSLGLKAGTLQVFLQAKHYAIHVLSVEQQLLAERFASKMANRFEGIERQEGIGGVPLLSGCAAVFECTSRSQYPEGDHVILVGEVISCRHDATRSPLLFHGGRFYTEHPL